MTSFTSSSERLPVFRQGAVLGAAFALFVLFVVALEAGLAYRGFRPGVIDTEARWQHERLRADRLGKRALILVGASRIQLDVDLGLLRHETGLQPVQLAIDGNSFVPVLRGLADDDRVTGTVLVDFSEYLLATTSDIDAAAALYQKDFQKREDSVIPDFSSSEAWLKDLVAAHLRSYADGARPLTSLLFRALDPGATPQYLVTSPDRSRAADYRMVPMPNAYYSRVVRELGIDLRVGPGAQWSQVDAALHDFIRGRAPVSNRIFLTRLDELAAMVAKVEKRGGRVYFIKMPVSGLVRENDTRLYPRQEFWAYLEKRFPGRTINAEDDAVMNGLVCPDGSHLDKRDKPRFTLALARELRQRGVGSE